MADDDTSDLAGAWQGLANGPLAALFNAPVTPAGVAQQVAQSAATPENLGPLTPTQVRDLVAKASGQGAAADAASAAADANTESTAPVAAPAAADAIQTPPLPPPPAAVRTGGHAQPKGAAVAPPPDLAGPAPAMLPGTSPEDEAAAARKTAKDAADSRQAAEEQEIKDAIAAQHAAGAQTGLQAFITNLASPNGELRKRQLAEAATPLQELQQKRQMLQQVQDERVKRDEQARQQALNDPDSELTKTSALALRAAGIKPIAGYTASMFDQVKGLGQMTSDQQEKAQRLLLDQRQAAEGERSHRADEALKRADLNERTKEFAGGISKEAIAKQNLVKETAGNAYAGLKEAHDKLQGLIDKYGTGGGITGPGRAEIEQARNEVAEQGIKLRQAQNPGAQLRPNAIEEERNLVFQPGFFQQSGSAKTALRNYFNNKAAEAHRLGVPTGGQIRHNGVLYHEDANGNAVDANGKPL